MITLPEYYDPDRDKVFLMLLYKNSTKIPPFMSYDNRVVSMRPSPGDEKIYNITVVLIDNSYPPQIREYYFLLNAYNSYPIITSDFIINNTKLAN